MSKVKIEGHGTGTGTFTVTTPSSNTDRTITLPDATGTLFTDAGGTMTGALTVSSDLNVNGEMNLTNSSGINYIDFGGSSLKFRNDNSTPAYEDMLILTKDGSVEATHNGSKKLETTATGIAVTGSTAHTEGSISNTIAHTYKLHGANGTGGSPHYCTYAFQGDDNTGMYSGTANTIKFATAGSEKVRIQSGGGISFNGDTAAANALDDYEEGTWTPAASGGASSVSGTYTKIGRLVHCEGSLTFPSQTNSGHATVEGLPFTINGSESGSRPTGAIRYTSYSAQDLFIHGNPSATTFNLYKKNTGGVGQASWTDMSGKRFDFNFIFQV